MTAAECEEGVTVLEERPHEEFEPTEEEVQNYAEWLGMDPEADADLMYLAREGLKAPLTDGWKPCQNAEGEIFYFNFETGESSWDHPSDETYRNLVQEKKREKAARGAAGARDFVAPKSAVPKAVPPLGSSAASAGPARCACFRRFRTDCGFECLNPT